MGLVDVGSWRSKGTVTDMELDVVPEVKLTQPDARLTEATQSWLRFRFIMQTRLLK